MRCPAPHRQPIALLAWVLVPLLLMTRVVMAQTPTAPTATTTPVDTEGSTPLTSLTELGLTASPPRYGEDMSVTVKPGEKRVITLKAINNTPATLKIETIAQDFVVGEDGRTPIPVEMSDTQNRWSLSKWLTITPNQQTLKPQESAGVQVIIEVPKDALPGGHYAMIMHQPAIDKKLATDGKQAAVRQRVGTLLYVVVDGPVTEKAFVRNLTVPQFQEFGPVPVSYQVENQGDVHIRPQTELAIYNWLGKKVSSQAIETLNIFPGSARDFASDWKTYWGWGRYQAQVTMAYGAAGALDVASVYFWVFPVRLVLAIIVALILITLITWFTRKQMQKRAAKQSAEVSELKKKVAELGQADEVNQPSATQE